MKKRVMVIGPSKSGKTSLIYALTGADHRSKGKQDLIYSDLMIDVPGVYLEHSGMHCHIIALAQQASHILMLVGTPGHQYQYPPGFAAVFNCPVIGVMNRMNEVQDSEQIWRYIGIKGPIFSVDTLNGTGIEQLRQYLFGTQHE